MHWEFFCFVGTAGKDVIRDWISKEPAGTRQRLQADLDALVRELMLVNRDQFSREDGVGQLRHKCAGLFELIMRVDKVQYRAIGFYGPERREFTLLSMDREKGNKFVEDPSCDRAWNRRNSILNRSHIREYFAA